MDRLDVEGLLDLGVGSDGEVDEDQSRDGQEKQRLFRD